MKRGLLVAAVVALLAAAGASAASKPGFLGCKAFTAPHSKLEVKPTSIIVACGDGGFYLTGLRWTSWGVAADANGVAHQNDCTPNCAAGHFHAYPVRIRLSALKTCHHRRELTKVAWRFTRSRPKGVPAVGSQTFRCA